MDAMTARHTLEASDAAAGDVWDVVVLGGGVAGAACAAALGRLGRKVLLIEPAPGRPKIGEVLAPACRPLLERLDVYAGAMAGDHLPCTGIDSSWEGRDVKRVEFFRSPYEHGWFLDRPRFDRGMRALAKSCGATLQEGVGLAAATRVGEGVELATDDGGRRRARFAVDATGRAARLAKALGATRQPADRLVAFARTTAAPGGSPPTPESLLLEAVDEGWWYAALLPDGRRVAVFLTDSDLPAAYAAASPEGFDAMLGRTRVIAPRISLSRSGWRDRTVAASAATSQRLDRMSGERWLAIGDAAIGRDPLSGSGLLHALEDAEAAAEALDTALTGDADAIRLHEGRMQASWRRHEAARRRLYSLPTARSWSPFWARRYSKQA